MKNAQQLLYNVLSLVCLAAAVLLSVQNLSVSVPVQLFTENYADITLGGLLALATLLGALAVAFRLLVTLQGTRTEARKATRELERTEVTAEESGQRAKALEAKIQTLEKALQDALKPHK